MDAAQTPACMDRKYQVCPPIWEHEDVEAYTPGGFHPIMLGDRLGESGRFEVFQKLGYGGFGTVWLCHDDQRKKWRAVKVLQAKASSEECPEFKTMRKLANADFQGRGGQYVQLPLEHFWQDGPNGRHLCFVMPLLGPDLTVLYREFADANPGVLNRFCFQMVEGLAFLHDNGVGHGDFRPNNILMRTQGVDDLDRDEMLGLMLQPEPEVEEIWRRDGGELGPHAPRHLVECNGIGLSQDYLTPDIAIIDYGVSFELSNPPNWTGIVTEYAAPEILLDLDAPLGVGADIWALACSIAKVRSGETPFGGGVTGITGILESMLGRMSEALCRAWDKLELSSDGDIVVPEGVDPSTVPHTISLAQMRRMADEWEERYGSRDCLEAIVGRLEIVSKPVWRTHVADDGHEAGRDAADGEGPDGDGGSTAERDAVPDDDADDGEADWEYADASLQVPKEELPVLCDLLRSMVQYLPEDRASMDQIMQHEWFGHRDGQKDQTEGQEAADGDMPEGAPEQQQVPQPSEMDVRPDSREGEPDWETRLARVVKDMLFRFLWPLCY